jgi:hypothetical protein
MTQTWPLLPQEDGTSRSPCTTAAAAGDGAGQPKRPSARSLLAAGKAKLKNNITFGIHGVDVNLQSAAPQHPRRDLTLHLRLLFVPATLNLHAE